MTEEAPLITPTNYSLINECDANGTDEMPMTPASSSDRNALSEARNNKRGVILEQDRFMPIANISRIMKGALPPQAKLSKESKECVQECVTEFLLFLTSEAAEKCHTERRKTITGDDLVWSLETLGFDPYISPIRAFQKKYKEANKVDRPGLEDGGNDDSLHDSTDAPYGVMNAGPSGSGAPTTTQIPPRFMIQPMQQQQHPPPLDTEMPPQLENMNGPNESGNSTSSAIGIGGLNLRPVSDVYIDPATSQHYIAVHSPGGTSGLIPIEIRAIAQSGQQAPTPMSLEAVAENMRQVQR